VNVNNRVTFFYIAEHHKQLYVVYFLQLLWVSITVSIPNPNQKRSYYMSRICYSN